MDINEIKDRLELLSGYNSKKGVDDGVLKEDRILKGHFIVEAARRHLFETHGYTNNITTYLERINKYVEDYCYRNQRKLFTTLRAEFDIPPSLFDDIQDKPFDVLNVHIKIHISPISGKERGGYYDSINSKISEDGSVACVNLQLEGLPNEFREQIYTVLGHELIHASEGNGRLQDNPDSYVDSYEDMPIDMVDYNEILGRKPNKHDMIAHNHKAKYGDITGLLEDYPDEYMFMFLYMTDTSEIHAFIGQIKSELEMKIDKIRSIEDCMALVQETDAYSRYQNCIMYLDYIKSLLNKPKTEEFRRAYSAYVAAMDDNTIRTTKQFWHKLTARFKKFDSLFNKQVPKITYDVYWEHYGDKNSKYERPIPKTNKLGHKK